MPHPDHVTISLLRGPLTAAVLDGGAAIEGIPLRPVAATSMDANSRAMLEQGFHIAEMSFATFLRARVSEEVPLVALPLFTGRRFVQPLVTCAPNAHIRGPGDLAGKRIAMPQFWMTSSVWHRGVLRTSYGVDPADVKWFTTATERIPALGSTGFTRVEGGRSPIDLLRGGEVDCVMSAKPIRGTSADTPALSPFDDPVAAQRSYFEATGVFPIMHLVVMREALLDERAELAREVVDLFTRAKSPVELEPPIPGLDEAETARVFGADPWAYGVPANAASLAAFLGHAAEQGLVDRRVTPQELFVEV